MATRKPLVVVSGVLRELPAGDTASVGVPVSRSFNVPDPVAAEKIVLFRTSVALTVSSISAVLPGASGGPSVTYSLRYAADVSSAGAEIVTGGSTVTSITTGQVVTSFNAAAIPAGSWVWLTTAAKAGTVPSMAVTIEF